MTPNQRALMLRAGDAGVLEPVEVRVLKELQRWTVPPREEELHLRFAGDWWITVAVELELLKLVEVTPVDIGGTRGGDLQLTALGREIADRLTTPDRYLCETAIQRIRRERAASAVKAQRERETREACRRIKRVVGKGGNPNDPEAARVRRTG